MNFSEPSPFADKADGVSHGKGYLGDGQGEGWVDTKWNKSHLAPEPDTDRFSDGSMKV